MRGLSVLKDLRITGWAGQGRGKARRKRWRIWRGVRRRYQQTLQVQSPHHWLASNLLMARPERLCPATGRCDLCQCEFRDIMSYFWNKCLIKVSNSLWAFQTYLHLLCWKIMTPSLRIILRASGNSDILGWHNITPLCCRGCWDEKLVCCQELGITDWLSSISTSVLVRSLISEPLPSNHCWRAKWLTYLYCIIKVVLNAIVDKGAYVQVTRDRDGKQSGVVDFAYEDDMRHAVKKLDDTEFERGCYIRVREEDGSPPRGRSRSRSPRRRSYSRSRSRSRSPARSVSRSLTPPGKSRR